MTRRKVGINGFGRIGRNLFRIIKEQYDSEIEVVAINNRSNAELSSFLLTHDTVHGLLKNKISHSDQSITIDGKSITALHFNFSSTDATLKKNKKLNTDVWYDEKTLLWVKASFEKQGYWEYRLSDMIFYK